MRGKCKFWLHLFLILSLIIITATVNLSPAYAQFPKLYVDPPLIIEETQTPGTIFTININVREVSGLLGFEFKLKFDTTILDAIQINKGDFFEEPLGGIPGGPVIQWKKGIYNDLGYVWYGLSLGSSSAYWGNGKSGDGTLATIDFVVEDVGAIPLDLYDTSLTDSSYPNPLPIEHAVYDGYFSNTGYANPVADFTFTSPSMWAEPPSPNPILGEPVTFNAAYDPSTGSGSYPIYGYIDRWDWDFGDGATGSEEIVEHVYTEAGTYTVTLTVTDSFGYTNTATKTVKLSGHNLAVINVQPNQTFVIQNRAISINVTVKNKGSETEHFNVTACYNGIPVALLQTGGMGPKYSKNLTFLWKTSGVAPGTYIISANVTHWPEEFDLDDVESILDDNIKEDGTVTILTPIARFTYSPIDPYRGQTVTFDASASTPSSGTITDYAWDFESDGTIDVYGADKIVVTHNYAEYGDYLVTLNITDSEGLWDIATDTVPVYPHPPIAQFTYSPKPPKSNVIITFNASDSYDPDGTIVKYVWNFSDGTIVEETDNVTTHTYLDIGAYPVNLTVIDNDGLNGSIVKILPVEIPPPSPQFTYSPMLPVEYEEITFDASKSSSYKGTKIVEYAWDFESDGVIDAYGVVVTHTYTRAGTYTVNLTVTDNSDPPLSGSILPSVVVERAFIEVEADVGTIHFVGEKAEFYFLVKFLGNPVDTTEPINAKLYYNGIIVSSFPTKVERVDTGLYRILWDPIPSDASSGTYTALIQASYFTLKDSTIKSFLISKTLTDWNPLLIRIDGTVGTIKTNLGLIKLNLKDINATLTEIIVDSKGETLAKIDSAVGTITAKLKDINATLTEIIVDNQGDILAKIDSAIGSVTTTLDTINAKVIAIDGNVATIETDVGTIKTDVATLKTSGVPTTPLYVTAVFSAIAAIIALIVLFILRRRKPT